MYDYEGEVRLFAENRWGKEIKEYTFRSMPEGNYGVGTILDARILDKNETPEKKWFLANTDNWFVDSVDEIKKLELLNNIIVDGQLGNIKIDKIITDRLDFEHLLPQFKKLLEQRNIDLDFRSKIYITLTSDEAVSRQLNWPAFKEAIDNGFIKKSVEQILNGNNIIIAEQDIILMNYTVTVHISRKDNLDVRFALSEAMENNFGERVRFKLHNTQSGLSAVQPVVIAALWKKKEPIVLVPSADHKSSNPQIIPQDTITNWPIVVIPKESLTQLELLLEE